LVAISLTRTLQQGLTINIPLSLNTMMKKSNEIALDATSVYRNYQGGYFKTLVSPAQTEGAFALMEMVLPRGAEPPLHLHTYEDETFYLLEGTLLFRIGDTETEVNPGEAVFAPRMVPHLFKILSNQARFITLISPGKFWEYFMEFSTPSTGELVVTPPQGPPPAEFIAHLISRMQSSYGITLI
jgi:quercetin dioxygenase-like cupin family protein